jgi:HSP20 family protein
MSKEEEMSDLMRWFDTRRSPIEMIERLFEGEVGMSGIRVEEVVDGSTLLVRAELPGIDPETDVDVTVSNGVLEIKAERKEKQEHKDKNTYRSEFRYGSFSRRVPLPEGARQEDVTASYKDGVLEVRMPVQEKAPAQSASKIHIKRD